MDRFVLLTLMLFAVTNAAAQSWQRLVLPSAGAVLALRYAGPSVSQPSTHHICAATSNGIFVSANFGASWTDVTANLPSRSVHALGVSSEKSLVVDTDSGLFIARIGEAWRRPVDRSIKMRVNAIDRDRDARLYASTADGLSLSLDRGDHWLALGPDGTNVLCSTVTDQGILYAGLDLGSGGGILRSIDFGITWDRILTDPVNVFAIALAPGGGLIAGTYGHNPFDASIRRSTALDTAWISSGLINSATGSLAWSEGSTLFAGMRALGFWPDTVTYQGVQRSTDAGFTWSDFNEGLGDLDVRCLLYQDGWLFAGTASGVYRRDLLSTGLGQPADPAVVGIDVYPQPVTSRLRISLRAPVADAGSIEIFNALGVMVHSEQYPIGASFRELHTDGWPSGLYVLRIVGSSHVLQRRFVIAK